MCGACGQADCVLVLGVVGHLRQGLTHHWCLTKVAEKVFIAVMRLSAGGEST